MSPRVMQRGSSTSKKKKNDNDRAGNARSPTQRSHRLIRSLLPAAQHIVRSYFCHRRLWSVGGHALLQSRNRYRALTPLAACGQQV